MVCQSRHGGLSAAGELVKNFLLHGRGDDPKGVEEEQRAAAEWQRRLMNDPELQKKLFAKDPKTMREFDAFGVYARDPRR